MKNVYLVTSAINTKFGIFDSNTRFLQTLDTYKSIKARDPDAILVHLEMAALPMSNLQKDVIASVTNHQITFTDDPQVKALYHSTDNWDIVKNLNEVMCFEKALSYLEMGTIPVDAERFFKVSGRYMLTGSFDPTQYRGDRFVFAKKRNSQFDPEVTGGCFYQFMSRCWSFPADKLSYVKEAYKGFSQYMLERLQANGYVDIEHCLYRTFGDDSSTVELDVVGVTGQIGPTGKHIED